MQPFRERLLGRPLILDGAMGTMLYARGVFVNACYDEVCLTRPALVAEVHRAYVEAGAEVIETNTFGANRLKLQPYGLAEQVGEINRAAVRIAREAAGDRAYVVGSMGPCLAPGQGTPGQRRDLIDAYAEQAALLAAAGVDALQLETFSRLDELLLAVRAAAATGLPLVASFACDANGQTAVGTDAEVLAEALEAEPAVSAIGLNCGVGPSGLFDVVQRVLGVVQKPVLASPNAGFPQQVQGRLLYVTTPEYFTEYAKRFVKLGVRGVGGCCGTTPEHLREAARAVRGLSEVRQPVVTASAAARAPVTVEVVPTAEKSRLARRLAARELVTSVELLPPKSVDLSGLIKKARQCVEAGVDAINVPDGPRASARVSSMIAALAIEREAGIEAVLHYACRDRNLIGMQSDLLGSFAAGLRNVLVITGDPPKLGDYPDATGVFDVDAIGLTALAAGLNHGVDVGGSPVAPPTALLLGVGADPGALDPARELDRMRQKIDAGAEFIITQPIFRPEKLFRFLDALAPFAGHVPVIAGVWPLASFRNAEFMHNEVPGVDIPDAVMTRLAAAGTADEARQVGVDLAREVIAALRPRIQGVQVSAPLGIVRLALAALSDVLPARAG